MVLYRRNYVPGGTFFFTVTLRDRHSDLLVQHVDLLRGAFAAVKNRRPFRIDAMVVMPDHLHAIWTLPAGDMDYSSRWRSIKAGFVAALARQGASVERNARGEAFVWQRRFWEHTLRNERDLNHHIDYIHYNPVKHCHVARPADWPHSTIHRFIQNGTIPADWGGSDSFIPGLMAERFE